MQSGNMLAHSYTSPDFPTWQLSMSIKHAIKLANPVGERMELGWWQDDASQVGGRGEGSRSDADTAVISLIGVIRLDMSSPDMS